MYALEPLADNELQQVEAQAGADLSLKLSLNQRLVSGKYVFDDGPGGICDKTAGYLGYCHLAIAVNKRFVRNGNQAVSDPTQANPANKLWLVFKGIQGTIDIQKLGLDGVDLVYRTDANADKIKPAMQLGFDATAPILIRNYGFNALSIEQDDFTSYIDASTGKLIEGTNPSSAPTSGYGYLKASTYNTTNAPNSSYDHGKETGFMGMQMNGNLAIQGKIMMFACDTSHPRC